MTFIIGKGAAMLCQYLEEAGFPAKALEASQAPSLTALLLEQEEAANMVLLQEDAWSMGHILAAAQLLQERGGKMILWGTREQPLPSLLHTCGSQEALPALLRRPLPKPESGQEKSGRQESPRVAPLAVPDGAVLILGVLGSQRRIGCTTQSVALWHYCKALGFDPAVVMQPETVATIALVLNGTEISGGYKVCGIPFVLGTDGVYDCYIVDLGDQPRGLETCDGVVLVAGSKPWEIANTAAGVQMVGDRCIAAILSYSTGKAVQETAPLFGVCPVYSAPYLPDLWRPSLAALTLYDRMFRQTIARLVEQGQNGEEKLDETDSANNTGESNTAEHKEEE